jgi:hypothetical protein
MMPCFLADLQFTQVTSYKTVILIFTSVRISNLIRNMFTNFLEYSLQRIMWLVLNMRLKILKRFGIPTHDAVSLHFINILT